VLSGPPSAFAACGLKTELFGQKIVFDFQLADLPVKFISLGLGLFAGLATLVENIGGTIDQRSFPVADHCGMNLKPGRQFSNGLIVFQGCQGDLRLELGRIASTFLAHGQILSNLADPELIILSSFLGPSPTTVSDNPETGQDSVGWFLFLINDRCQSLCVMALSAAKIAGFSELTESVGIFIICILTEARV
jgi:hypothetical protein